MQPERAELGRAGAGRLRLLRRLTGRKSKGKGAKGGKGGGAGDACTFTLAVLKERGVVASSRPPKPMSRPVTFSMPTDRAVDIVFAAVNDEEAADGADGADGDGSAGATPSKL